MLGRARSVTDATVPFRSSAVGMDDDLVELVRQIHASPTLAVFYVAGGGLQVKSVLPCSPLAWDTKRPVLVTGEFAQPWP